VTVAKTFFLGKHAGVMKAGTCRCGDATACRTADASSTRRRHGAGVSRCPDGDRDDAFSLGSVAEARRRAGERPVARPG